MSFVESSSHVRTSFGKERERTTQPQFQVHEKIIPSEIQSDKDMTSFRQFFMQQRKDNDIEKSVSREHEVSLENYS